jgi:hypothetical protein
VPEGPHYVYIFQHRTKPWFKIGESRNPISRRKNLGSFLRSNEYRKWKFEDYFACFYVEQAAIRMMRNFGFVPVRSPDWFEVNQPTMDAIIISIDELTKSISDWEEMNASADCDAARQEKPYGAYLFDTMFVPLDHWYEVSPGCWEPSGTTLEERLNHELKWREKRKAKIPEGLARLAATVWPNEKISSEG